MGSGYKFQCEKCGYGLEYLQGVGFFYCAEADNILTDMKNGKMGKKFMEYAKKSKTPTIIHSRELYKCINCGEVRPDMKIELYNGKSLLNEKRHICGKCRSKMNIVKDTSKLKCPHCATKLLLSNFIMWD